MNEIKNGRKKKEERKEGKMEEKLPLFNLVSKLLCVT